MEVLKKIAGYINVFKKKDPNQPSSFSLKLMHGMNKISIMIFLVAVVYMIARAFMK